MLLLSIFIGTFIGISLFNISSGCEYIDVAQEKLDYINKKKYIRKSRDLYNKFSEVEKRELVLKLARETMLPINSVRCTLIGRGF